MSELNLFGDNTEELVLPSSNTETKYENKYDLDKLLLGKKVKVLNIKESSNVEQPNIIVNLDKVGGKLNVMQKLALRAVKVEDGEYTLYIYSDKIGLASFGKTSGKMLPILCYISREVFDGNIDIYRNYNPDTEELETVSEKEIRDYRLRL